MNTNKPTPVNPLVEGQMVIIVARFVLIAACLFLILMDARSAKTVSFLVTRLEIIVVLLLAVSNFYLVSQVLTKRKTMDFVLYGMSLADLAVISLVVIVQGGFESGTYIFYFPAMLSFALAFPMMELYLFLGGTITLYSFISLFTIGTVDNMEVLMVRLLMLIAVAVCGNRFAQIERNRRAAILNRHFTAQQPEVATSALPVPQQQVPVH